MPRATRACDPGSMGWLGPTRQERQLAAAAALAPYGFTVDLPSAAQIFEYRPLRVHATPETPVVAAHGRVGESTVSAYEYDYSRRDAEGNVSRSSELVVVAHHPRLLGGAAFVPEHREWNTTAQVLDVLFWIPPFTLLKAFEWLAESRDPDRNVGHAEFDRLYRVRAASDAAAQRAISPRLRETAVRLGFYGYAELRDGVLLYSVNRCAFDGEGVVRALGYAAPLIASAIPEPAHPFR